MAHDTTTADFTKPHKIDDATLAFPASVRSLMPAMDGIPDEFCDLNGRTKWNVLTSKWFFTGLRGKFVPKPGINLNDAMRHLSAIMGSYEPKHEHKEAAVSYLMSLWFDRFEPSDT